MESMKYKNILSEKYNNDKEPTIELTLTENQIKAIPMRKHY